jgi:predicted nucleotidyltransferase
LCKAKKALQGENGVDVIADLLLSIGGNAYRFHMDKQMMEHIKRKTLLDVEIPVIPVEDNIILKCILQRGEKEHKHDIADVRSMLVNERIDFGYLACRIRFYRAEIRVYPILRELEYSARTN